MCKSETRNYPYGEIHSAPMTALHIKAQTNERMRGVASYLRVCLKDHLVSHVEGAHQLQHRDFCPNRSFTRRGGVGWGGMAAFSNSIGGHGGGTGGVGVGSRKLRVGVG